MKIVLKDVGSDAAVKAVDLLKMVIDKVWDMADLMTRNGIDKSEIQIDRVMMTEFKYAVDNLLNNHRAEKEWLCDGVKRLNLQVKDEDNDTTCEIGYTSGE